MLFATLRSLSKLTLIGAALLLTACSGGGGGKKGSTGLLATADLNGVWRVTIRVTAVTPGCTSVVGEENVEDVEFSFDRPTGALTVEPGTPDQFVGRLSGVTASFSETTPDGSSRFTLTFNRAGTSFSGSGVESSVAESCTESLRITGVRLAGPTSGIGSVINAITVGARRGVPSTSPLPPVTSAITANLTGSNQVVAGGSGLVTVSSASQFNSIAMAIQGVSGHIRVDLPARTTSAQMVVALQSVLNLPGIDGLPAIPCQFQLGLDGAFGPPADFTFQIEIAGQGALNINLTWDTEADLDLHVMEPDGFVIFFGNTVSPSGGELDLDGNAGCITSRSVENVTYAGVTPPIGLYRVFVDTFDNCNAPLTNFAVRVNQEGRDPLLELRQATTPTSNPVEILSFTR
jgi:hypothetical protein